MIGTLKFVSDTFWSLFLSRVYRECWTCPSGLQILKYIVLSLGHSCRYLHQCLLLRSHERFLGLDAGFSFLSLSSLSFSLFQSHSFVEQAGYIASSLCCIGAIGGLSSQFTSQKCHWYVLLLREREREREREKESEREREGEGREGRKLLF